MARLRRLKYEVKKAERRVKTISGRKHGAFIYGPLDTILKWSLLALAYLALNPVPGLTGVTMLFVIVGLCGGGYGLLMAHARASVPEHLAGVA
jgi:hypothetical protein